MGCVEFVDWIIDTGIDLGWAGFQAGFLKMLEQAYYAVAFINDRATDSVKLVRQSSICKFAPSPTHVYLYPTNVPTTIELALRVEVGVSQRGFRGELEVLTLL